MNSFQSWQTPRHWVRLQSSRNEKICSLICGSPRFAIKLQFSDIFPRLVNQNSEDQSATGSQIKTNQLIEKRNISCLKAQPFCIVAIIETWLNTRARNLIFFWPKAFFWSNMKMTMRTNFHKMSQGPPNPGFTQEKVQKRDFLKKPSWELKN